MKVKQKEVPYGNCYDCCFFYDEGKNGCYKIKGNKVECGPIYMQGFNPWVEAADGTHSWNKQKKTLRKL